jgi:hypothetical protein
MLLMFHRLTVNELFAEKSSIWLFEDLLVFGALSKSDTVMYYNVQTDANVVIHSLSSF